MSSGGEPLSDGTYRRAEEVDESPTPHAPEEKLPANFTSSEKPPPPRDLGTHKVMFGQQLTCVNEKKNKEALFPESITIVQDEYCSKTSKEDQKNQCVRKRVIVASVLCVIFIVVEFIGGFLSNSLVIVADATQLLTVFSTLIVSLLTLRMGERRSLTWGNREVAVTLCSVLLTWVLTSIVLYVAYERIAKNDFIIDVDMMLATSAFGVVANLVMGMTLHNYCNIQHPADCRQASPSASTSPHSTGHVSFSVRSAFIHIFCDFLFSLAVFITALFIDCCPDWHIVDPISTFVFSIFVLFVTVAVLRDLLNVLIESTPKGIFVNEILKTLLTVEGVQQVQDLRLWAVSLDKIALSAHLTIRPNMDHNEVLQSASRRIQAKYNFYEMTLHIEVSQKSCADSVPNLQLPPPLPETK